MKKKTMNLTIKLWGRINLFLLKIIKLKVEIILDDHYKGQMPTNSIIAAQHQSMIEIIALCYIIPNPTFLFKDSLLKIPFFGTMLRQLNMIPVSKQRYNQNWLRHAMQSLDNGKNVIIFPEGTRTAFKAQMPYSQGVFKLAEHANKQIIPIALNTAKFWPKNTLLKLPGTAKIIIDKPMEADPAKLRKRFDEIYETEKL